MACEYQPPYQDDERVIIRAKSARFLTSRQRLERIRVEQVKAAQQRMALEAARPKIIIPAEEADKLKRPQFHLQLGKLKMEKRAQSIEPRSGRRPSKCESQRISYKPEIVTARPPTRQSVPTFHTEASVLPGWITERQDFVMAYNRLKEECFQDVENICRKSSLFRTEEEVQGLRKWTLSWSVFQGLKKGVLKESMNRMHTVDFPEKTKGIFQIVSLGQALYILIRGVVVVHYNAESPKRLEGKGIIGAEIIANSTIKETDCVTETAATFIRLSKFDYDQSVLGAIKQHQIRSAQLLISAPFFSTLSETKIRNVSSLMEEQRFAQGAVIYEYGDVPEYLYVVKEGEVALQVPVSVNQNNRWPVGEHAWEIEETKMVYNLELKTCRRGDSFGALELIEHSLRTMNAAVLSPCSCYKLSQTDFLQLFTRKEVEAMEALETMHIPSNKKLSEKVMQKLKAEKQRRDTLVAVVKVDPLGLEARESFLDKQTRKMRKWMKNLQMRTNQENRKSREGLVSVRHRRLVINQDRGNDLSRSDLCD